MSHELINAAQALVDGWDSLKLGDFATMMKVDVERLRKALAPQRNSAAQYERMTPEKKAQFDKIIEIIDAQRAAKRESRDRRKVDIPYQASGLPDRRLADRRKNPRDF